MLNFRLTNPSAHSAFDARVVQPPSTFCENWKKERKKSEVKDVRTDFNKKKKKNNNKSYDQGLECEIQQCSENKEHLVDRKSWHSSCRLFIF